LSASNICQGFAIDFANVLLPDPGYGTPLTRYKVLFEGFNFLLFFIYLLLGDYPI
jgi:hypothetical protein